VALARCLLRRRARLVLWSRDSAALHALVSELQASAVSRGRSA